MGYTIDDSICRVVLFKKLGDTFHFHCNIAVPFNGNFENSMKEFLSSAKRKIDQTSLSWKDIYAVCLEPYLPSSDGPRIYDYPVMINIGKIIESMSK